MALLSSWVRQQLSQSVIQGNTSSGMLNAGDATTTAENNYWGAYSGPYNATYNPGGTGNAVSNKIDFNPWLGGLNYTSNNNAVNDVEIEWDGSTAYSTAWNNAISTWDALGSINIRPADHWYTSDLTVEDVDYDDVDWVGKFFHNPNPLIGDTIQLNSHLSQSAMGTSESHAVDYDP